MFDILESLNLFPYSHLWRISREEEHSNKCSIIVSIAIIAAITATFVQRIVMVISRETMIAS
jgi:hypothetical protein